jgi:N4-gp56 family major capsid protein
MSLQGLNNTTARIGKFKGEILAHAVPVEVLGITGVQKSIPKNNSRTVVYRRFLPYGATSASPNTWVVDAQKHITQEGVTPAADTLVPQDIEVTLQQYAVLYGLTDQMVDMHEDGPAIEEAMKRQTGERLGLVREKVRYGALKGLTNKYYAGGSSRATVSKKLTLPLLQQITRSLKANHAKFITSVLAPSANFATAPVEASYLVFGNTNLEQDIRALPGFTPVANYGSRKPVNDNEIGSCESYRFILSPDLDGMLNAGAAVASAPGLVSTGGSNIDVYPVIVAGQDAWGQVALRGMDSIDVTYIKPGQKDSADPLGQRGYIGAKNYFACVVLNNGWAACAEVGISDLTV